MLATHSWLDPFAEPRDPLEDAVNSRIFEFFIASLPRSIVYRQKPGSYALIAPQRSGARVLTVPGANEADFMFHGAAGEGVTPLADFISATILESGVDHLRLPLLNEPQASILKKELSVRLPNWLWAAGPSAVAPMVLRKPSKLHSSFRRAMIRAEKEGVRLERALSIDLDELKQLHERRWGAGNRSASFFQMLRMLMDDCGAQLFTARTGDGRLVGAQLDILGGQTRHFYYGISDKDAIPGVGTAVMGMSWSAFLAGNEVEYSFGRGAERYKYRYADAVRIMYEVRGFLAPVTQTSLSNAPTGV